MGEAPGKMEEFELRPFVGPSGEIVRKTLKWAGVAEDDVRFSNVVRHNPGTFPSGKAGWALMEEYWDELDDEMASMSNLRVVVACGAIALRRLVGETSISDWRGSVLRAADLHDMSREVAGRGRIRRANPNVRAYVPVLHPAGIMRGGWDEMILFRRDVRKVAAVLTDTLRRVDMRHHFNVPPEALLAAAEGAEWMYFDTEYHRESKQLYWFGVTFNGVDVFGVPWSPEYADVIQQILARPQLLKGAHNISADMEALGLAGVKVTPPIFDTQVGFHTLYPTLLSRLNVAASYYLDDIKFWKDMDHHDPRYNALDVAYGAQCMVAERQEAVAAGDALADEMAARMTLVRTTFAMYQRGMLVDMGAREGLLRVTGQELDTRTARIRADVGPMWDKRVRQAQEAKSAATALLEALKALLRGRCADHPTYDGFKKYGKRKCPECLVLWQEAAKLQDKYADLKKRVAFWTKELKRFDRAGFTATNPEHLKWLLYSPDALHLPIQRHHKTKLPTTDEEAIDKLSRLAYMRTPARAKALALVMSIKRVQELAKARSTFISLERTVEGQKISLLDVENRVHPVYGRYTETGRMAGAGEEDEKTSRGRAFYALNIPKAWRRLYIAPPGQIIVSADWRNVEGRLTAHFSQDVAYQRALDNELTGGPKVHSLNAAIIFGCKPEEAERFKVQMGGQTHIAYDLGKKLTHAWSYGMGIDTMMRHFRISRAEAERVNARLSDAYPQLVLWRQRLIAAVLGIWEGKRCLKAGSRVLQNPFGWRRHFMGVGYGQSNEVLAFLPQSSGGSMLARVVPRVDSHCDVMVAVHDSVAVLTAATDDGIDGARAALMDEMQQSWPQLDGKSFPISLEVGYNWGPVKSDNPRGMTAIR